MLKVLLIRNKKIIIIIVLQVTFLRINLIYFRAISLVKHLRGTCNSSSNNHNKFKVTEIKIHCNLLLIFLVKMT